MAMEGNCVLRARTWKIVHMMRMRDFLLSREIMVNSSYPHLIQRGEPLKHHIPDCPTSVLLRWRFGERHHQPQAYK